MKFEKYDLPDLRNLTPAQRKTAIAKHKNSQAREFQKIDVKRDIPNGQPLDGRTAVRQALIQAGGIYNADQIDAVAAVAHSQAATAGTELTLDETFDRLAVDATMLGAAITEVRAVMPEEFVDISRIDKFPETRQFGAKLQLINKYAKRKRSLEQISARAADPASARAARKPRPI